MVNNSETASRWGLESCSERIRINMDSTEHFYQKNDPSVEKSLEVYDQSRTINKAVYVLK